jgi:type IV secretory pathway TrbF-like protein
MPLTLSPPFENQVVTAQRRETYWRRAFFIAVSLAFLLTCSTIYFAASRQVFPYVATIRPGEALTLVGVIPSTFDLSIHSVVTREYIFNWLWNSHQLTAEPAAYDELYAKAEAFQSQKFTTTQRPFKLAQRKRLEEGKSATIADIVVQPLAGTNFTTWEIDWKETTYSIQGYEVPNESGTWHATVRVIQGKPLAISAPGFYLNPFRVFIDEFSPQQRTKGY